MTRGTIKLSLAVGFVLGLATLEACGRETAEFTAITRTAPTQPPQEPLPNVISNDSSTDADPPVAVNEVPQIPTDPLELPESPASPTVPQYPAEPEQPAQPEQPVEEPEQPEQPVETEVRFVTDAFRGQEKVLARSPDIIFLVDTSGSMSWEKAYLERETDSFVQQLLGYQIQDFQLMMVGQNFHFPSSMDQHENFEVVKAPIGSFDSLDVLLKLFKGEYETKLQFRRDHPKEIIIVSDDNYGLPVFVKPDEQLISEFLVKLQALGVSNVRFSGIVGFEVGQHTPSCNISRVGSVYKKLAAMQKPAGLIQNLCEEDWGMLLENMGTFIVERTLERKFALSQTIDGAHEVLVEMDGQVVSSNFYTIDYGRGILEFKSGHTPPKDAIIKVTYATLP